MPVFGVAALGVLALGMLFSIPACATHARPRLAPSAEEWSYEALTGRRLRTENFDIVTTTTDRTFEEHLPEFLEDVHARFERMLPPPPAYGAPGAANRAPARSLTIYLFGRRQEWEYFTRRRFPARYETFRRIQRGGYTEGGMSVTFYTDRGATLATLAHETWHQYVGLYFGDVLPAWLNEGLASYHEAPPRPDLGLPPPRDRNPFRRNSLCEALQRGTLLSLSQLVATDPGQIMIQDDSLLTQVYYGQAWALVTFLMSGPEGSLRPMPGRYAGSFSQLLQDVSEGRFRARLSAVRLTGNATSASDDGTTVIRAYFGREPADLEDEYYDHLVRICGF